MKNNGCLDCHFSSLVSNERDGMETSPLPEALRSRSVFIDFLKNTIRARTEDINCSHGLWGLKNIGFKNTAEIERAVFGENRGKSCPRFSPCVSFATAEAVTSEKKRKDEVIGRRVTWALAIIALIISIVFSLVQFFFKS